MRYGTAVEPAGGLSSGLPELTRRGVLFVLGGLVVAVSTSALSAPAVSAPARGNAAGTPPASDSGFFGVATAGPDGEICLQLRSAEPGGPVAESYQCYGPQHPDFAMIRDHVGPIPPGQSKVIRPFP